MVWPDKVADHASNENIASEICILFTGVSYAGSRAANEVHIERLFPGKETFNHGAAA